MALANLVAQILIVVTGGVVRLTGSGLGCPTWPKCTDASLVTVPEQGIHGVIEFANRLLTFALIILAAWLFLAVCGQVTKRAGMLWPALAVIAGIFVQAVVGGVSVLFRLNPWIVASHFVISGLLIVVASLMWWRTLSVEHQPVAPLVYALTPWLSIVGAVTVLVGVLVTGAGPHAGDANTPRNGLPLEILEHVHSYPAYILLALTLMVFGRLRRTRVPGATSVQFRAAAWLLVGICIQALVGVVQARIGVPATLVAIHMFGAATLISLLTIQFLSVRGK